MDPHVLLLLLKEDGPVSSRTGTKEEPLPLSYLAGTLTRWIPQSVKLPLRNKRRSSAQKADATNANAKAIWRRTAPRRN